MADERTVRVLTYPHVSSEEVARFTGQPGTRQFKSWQAAFHYSLPELRSLLREARAELHAAEQLDTIDAAWWREWIAILSKGIEQRLLSVLNNKPILSPKGVPHLDIDMVKERSDIVAIVEPHTELKKMGRTLKGLCPFHSEHTPSFHVWPEENKYHCFGCNEHGSVLDFVMKIRNLNLTDGLHFLADQAGIKWPEPQIRKAAIWSTEI